MGTCSGNLPCLVLVILSLTLRTFCMAQRGNHISRASLLLVWIVQFTRCVHVWRMCVDAQVIKILDVFKLSVAMEISDGEPPVLVLGLKLF